MQECVTDLYFKFNQYLVCVGRLVRLKDLSVGSVGQFGWLVGLIDRLLAGLFWIATAATNTLMRDLIRLGGHKLKSFPHLLPGIPPSNKLEIISRFQFLLQTNNAFKRNNIPLICRSGVRWNQKFPAGVPGAGELLSDGGPHPTHPPHPANPSERRDRYPST